jgi:uncharacterized protein YecT (DUF1311 family)
MVEHEGPRQSHRRRVDNATKVMIAQTRERDQLYCELGHDAQHDFVFYQNLLSLLVLESTDRQKLSDPQSQRELYRSKSCEAIDYLYRRGSIQSSAVTRCRIELLRGRMRALSPRSLRPAAHSGIPSRPIAEAEVVARYGDEPNKLHRVTEYFNSLM